MAAPKQLPAPTYGPRPSAWGKTPAMLIAGEAAIADADNEARRCEAKWGADRLRLLVDRDLREKFDRQRYKLNHAIWHGELHDVKTEAERMVYAWQTLDEAADYAGAKPLSPRVLETATEDGTVIAILLDGATPADVPHEGRRVACWTLDEIGTLLGDQSLVNATKLVFPGAKVTRVKTSIYDPLDAIPDTQGELDDEIIY